MCIRDRISNCYFEGNTSGAVIEGIVENCIFANNEYGVCLSDSVVLINNVIQDNTVGIASHVPGFMNSAGLYQTPVKSLHVENNLICNDSINVRTPWKDTTFDFSQNYWCLTDSTDIANLIQDWHDSTDQMGIINFMDFDTVPQVSDLVFPGDANHDQIANNTDFLQLGVFYGQTGPTRPNATLNWEGQWAMDWDTTQANGYDIKHVDCDGNGTIDNDDGQAILLNYGLTHSSQRVRGGSTSVSYTHLRAHET